MEIQAVTFEENKIMRIFRLVFVLFLAACFSQTDGEIAVRKWSEKMGYTVERVECLTGIGMATCSLRVREVTTPISLNCQPDGCTLKGR